MIQIEKLSKTYRSLQALKGVDLFVPEGELFAYLGPNGAGKTTTIRILTGLTRPSSGDAWLNRCHIQKDRLGAKRQCGLVPQSINLDPELTVYENLDVHSRLFGMNSREKNRQIGSLLEYVDMDERQHSQIKQLSGGMKRRVMIARALVHSPKILFLDEPTVGLDANIRRRIWALIKKIQGDGTTIFLTTHYIEEAEFLAHRVAFLDAGEIIALNRPQSLMDGLGAWAVDQVGDDDMETRYFQDKAEAKAFCLKQEGEFAVRRVNLEDVFLSLTGRKVEK